MKRAKNNCFADSVRQASIALASLAAVSCSNNLSGNGVPTIAALEGLGGSSNTTYALTIDSVLKDNLNPSTTLDVVGDGSGTIGSLCTAASGSTSATTGASTCACTYTYDSPSEGAASVDVDTLYHESNLIECDYTTIPSDVTTVTVQIHVTSENAYSNSISFNLLGTSGANPTNISNYQIIQRFQCKDVVSIPYPFGPALGTANSLIDPIESEDPAFTYPLNYYGTNLGFNYSQFVQSDQTGWYCPSNPNDPNFGVNYKLFSEGPDSAGSYEIYPPAGSAFDRSTFYVSSTQTGVFTIPLNAYIAPNLVSSNLNTPLGYAAAPIPSGTNEETCPNSVTLPTGYHWVKVWLFRADLPDRYYTISSAVQSLNEVACNPGNWNGTGSSPGTNPVFPDCKAGATGQTIGFDDSDWYTGALADRVLYGEGLPSNNDYMCVGLENTNPSSPPAFAVASGNYGPGESTYGALASGTDMWLPREGIINPFSTPTIPSSILDPMDIGGKKSLMPKAPKDTAPQTVDLDNGNPRYDFVYVVTPETVMAVDMENSSDTSIYPYMPFRFPNASDCLSPNPNNPLTTGDCNPSKIIHYGLKLHDVASNGDPPASDPSRPGIYPMCAIQPNSN